ncbi:hypothetical protein M8J76_011797 [Diaphorina citri]|nr:hypothetical protein M8J76_011797 [Diaphorina citri]
MVHRGDAAMTHLLAAMKGFKVNTIEGFSSCEEVELYTTTLANRLPISKRLTVPVSISLLNRAVSQGRVFFFAQSTFTFAF